MTDLAVRGEPTSKTSLADPTEAIDAALSGLLADAPDRPERLVAAMRHAVLGPGKRLRPRLTLSACKACGGEPHDAMPAACAVELVHAYSLVHDDLPAMDDDDLRRGRPTVHRAFDEATAILAGDALLALAFEALCSGRAAAPTVARACRELAVAAGPGELVGGQADDLAGVTAAGDDADGSRRQLERIHRRKTGAMIRVSLRLGGVYAEASEPKIDALTRYGDAIGLAFQVTDDLLDAVGDEGSVGKRVGKDAEAGKLTYPTVLGIDDSRAYAAELVASSTEALDEFGDSADPLRALAHQILDRDR